MAVALPRPGTPPGGAAVPRYVLDHVALTVSDFESAREFYEAALEPLGFTVELAFDEPPLLAMGLPARPQFWLREGKPSAPIHIAFHAADRSRVDAFHAAALAAGGRDNGAPGVRSYGRSYYAAYALDPDGNNVEAVCHAPA